MVAVSVVAVNDVLCTVEAELGKRYPGEPVYWNLPPKDFPRPSFALECTKDESLDVAAGLVRRNVTVLVTCFVARNADGDSERVALNERMDAMLAMFGSGALAVGDRLIQASAAKGVGCADASEVSALVTWTDTRPGIRDPEADAALMRDYELNVMRKE